ncbi:type II toxin-antitoxin system RelE/ParE family toxin [Burkholderia gladioli]|uniref:type II toxin-antitoxin system RelE/ParE family toxin n=1 Tax=Burkholderia gladioli TaxID=28095 RepID=UPI002E7A3EFD|nr:type II toxin-antitoxin system RelE/ParE family toxin [Burkholderia gladioli]
MARPSSPACAPSMGVRARVVRLTPLAEADLENIWVHALEPGARAHCERDVSELVTALEQLARGASPGRPGDARDAVCRHRVGSHEVFYRESATTLDVIRVLNHGMDVDPPL